MAAPAFSFRHRSSLPSFSASLAGTRRRDRSVGVGFCISSPATLCALGSFLRSGGPLNALQLPPSDCPPRLSDGWLFSCSRLAARSSGDLGLPCVFGLGDPYPPCPGAARRPRSRHPVDRFPFAYERLSRRTPEFYV